MKIVRYIYLILLFLGWYGQINARTIQRIGVMDSPEGKVACFELLPSDQIESISVVLFNMVNGEKTTVEATGYRNGNYYFINIPQNVIENNFSYQFNMTLSDGEEFKSSKYDMFKGRWFDWLGSDVKWTEAETDYPKREPLVDACYSYDPAWGLPFNRTTYYKAIVTCAKGHFTFDFPEDTPYDILELDYGVATFDTETWSENGDVRFVFTVNGEKKEENVMYAPGFFSSTAPPPYTRHFETSISGGSRIIMSGDCIDDNDGDIMVFALPRVYFKQLERQEQTIDWDTEKTIDESRPFTYTLTAKASSGLPICYRLVHGDQYARLEGDILNVTEIPENDFIEIEAFQPGNGEYEPSDVYRCRFTVSGKKIVGSKETYQLYQNEEIDEIIVKGDKESVGQLSVDKGAANVKKLVLQYTFIPGEWNFISFPSNADLNKITNLESLGYTYNRGEKAFYVLEYNTKKRAENPEETAWTRLEKPSVLANKGYIMGVSRSPDNPTNDPVTVTFTFDNLTLDLNKEQNGIIGVNMDFYEVTPETEIPVYIKPANGVKGNIMKINVKFEPKTRNDLAMNYQYELEQSRITFNPNRSGIRITLPTSETAKVLIFDKKERLVKAVRYESPFLIDIQDLKKGEYQVLIQYGNAQEYKKLVIE